MSAASSPCRPRPLFKFDFTDTNSSPNKLPSSPPMPIQKIAPTASSAAAAADNANNYQDSPNHWLFHSFSAPCRTHLIGEHGGGVASYNAYNNNNISNGSNSFYFGFYDAGTTTTDESIAKSNNDNNNHHHHNHHHDHHHNYHHFLRHHHNHHLHHNDGVVPSLAALGCGCAAGGGVLSPSLRTKAFVRSQSESAALNKLVQLNAQQHTRPRHFLDEFEIWRNRKGQGAVPPAGTASAGPVVGSGREVKFFDEPHPLQSDSEGEDSLVSPDEEVSPSASCAEEEEEEDDGGEHRAATTVAAALDDDVLLLDDDELLVDERMEGLDIVGQQPTKLLQQQQQDAMVLPKMVGFSDHLHQQQHHQLMMAPPRFVDSLLGISDISSLAANTTSCLSSSSPMAVPYSDDHPHPMAHVEPSSADYLTVPSMLATVDIAVPAEPSPLVQLPFQVAPLCVELCHRRPSLDEPATVAVVPRDQDEMRDWMTPSLNIDHADAEAKHLLHIADDNNMDGKLSPEQMLNHCDTSHVVVAATAVAATMPRPLKCVRFADDCGQCLETVRVMTEPSDYPPKISPAVLRRIRRAAAASSAISVGTDGNGQPINASAIAIEEDSDELDEFEAEERQRNQQHRRSWKMAFRQPASEYVRFRDTLDRQRVALENVMVKNELSRMVGTIKVANIAFEKHVFVRHTANGWKTFNDVEAKWQCSPSKAFDTFRFDVPLPRNEMPFFRVEFCVRFLAGSSPFVEEHWDSNDGHNFVLLSYDQCPPTTTALATRTMTPTATTVPSSPQSTTASSSSAFSSSSSSPVAQMTPTATKSGGAMVPSASSSSCPSLLLDINHNNMNNNGIGIGTSSGGRSSPRPIERCVGGGIGTGICDRDDPYRVDWNSPNGWSSTTFAAWKQLTTDGPYW